MFHKEKRMGGGGSEESLGRHKNMPYSFHYRKTPPEKDKLLTGLFLLLLFKQTSVCLNYPTCP